jgi:serine O-acetyltransferase
MSSQPDLQRHLASPSIYQELFGWETGRGVREGIILPFKKDLGRYIDFDFPVSPLKIARTVLENEGLWATFAYRAHRWIHSRLAARPKKREKALLRLLKVPVVALESFVRFTVDIHLDVESRIGPGLYVGHFKSIHVGRGVQIGRDCNIGQMCFLGGAERYCAPGFPIVGDRVYFGIGSKVMGGVHVGSDVAVGANAVILEDVPDRAVVVGNPAKVINYGGSEDFISIKKRDAGNAPLIGTAESRAQ